MRCSDFRQGHLHLPKSVPAQWLDDLKSHSRGHGPRLRVWELAGTAPSRSAASKRSNARGSLPFAVPAQPQPRSTGVATRAGQARRQVSIAVSRSPPKSADPRSKVALRPGGATLQPRAGIRPAARFLRAARGDRITV